MNPADFNTAHLDGYSVDTLETEDTLEIWATLVGEGEVKERKLFWRVSFPGTNKAVDFYPEYNRRKKLLAALLRALNEGGEWVELHDAFNCAVECLEKFGARIGLPVVAVESEETHARTFLLPDRRYLRVIEGEVSEVLTVEEMQALIEGREPEEDGLGQII